MADLRVDIAAEFTGKKAFDKAGKATNSLNKTVLNLARTFGPAVLGAAIVKFGKDAAQAFIEDQKQATRLANVVKNLGLELSNPAISAYIDKLTIASGVSDSQLRPALQALLTTTGDLTKSQELLSQAIDISAGSGYDLTQVAKDLADAYVGKTKGLSKYNLGLTQAQLKTMKFTELVKLLNNQFQGANAAYLETYAGRLQAITNAAGEAQEAIGGALVDALMTLTSSDNTAELITNIENATQKIIDFIDWFTLGIALIKANTPKNPLEIIFPNFKRNEQDTAAAWKDYNDKRMRRSNAKAWEGITTPAQAAEQKKAAALAAKRAKDIAAAQEKQTKELKKQAALKKAGTLFDLDQIQIIAALKGQISDQDRKRLELQFALLTGNEDEAKRLTYELAKAQGLGEHLANYLASLPDAKNPFASWEAYLDMLQRKAEETAAKIAAAAAGAAAKVVGSTTTTYVPSIANGYAGAGTTAYAEKQSYSVPATNVVALPTTAQGYAGAGSTAMAERQQYVEIKITGGDDLTKAIANNLQQQSLSSGNATYINRRTGGFE